VHLPVAGLSLVGGYDDLGPQERARPLPLLSPNAGRFRISLICTGLHSGPRTVSRHPMGNSDGIAERFGRDYRIDLSAWG